MNDDVPEFREPLMRPMSHAQLAAAYQRRTEPRICATRERLSRLLDDALRMGRYLAVYDRERWIAQQLDALEREEMP